MSSCTKDNDDAHEPRRSTRLKQKASNYTYYISATKLRNHALHDPLSDYLDVFGPPSELSSIGGHDHHQKGYLGTFKNKAKLKNKAQNCTSSMRKKLNTFTNYLFSRGNEFEKQLIGYFDNKELCKLLFGKQFTTHKMKPHRCWRNRIDSLEKNRNMTIKEMSKGTQLIYQPYVVNHDNQTFGQPDLLIREDAFRTIFKSDVVFPPNTKFDHKFNYLVVDIKCSTLKMSANGVNFQNNGSSPAIKVQLCVYQHALNQMQDSSIMTAYILCKRCATIATNGTQQFSDNLGTIDFANYDSQHITVMNDGIAWLHRLYRHGASWSILPRPTVVELYPNLSTPNQRWDKVKRAISNTLCDITQIWHCGVKQRENALKHSITSWKDRNCTAKVLGFKPDTHRYRIVNEILRINRGRQLMSNVAIRTNEFNWKEKNQLEFFVDFETINDITSISDLSPVINTAPVGKNERIFMIGIGYRYPNDATFHYNTFIANNLTLGEEQRILDEFEAFMIKTTKSSTNDTRPNIYHWGNAEQAFMQRAQKRHQRVWYSLVTAFNWFDFSSVMRNEPIVIKGAMNFGLKSIGNAMYKHGMIDIQWDTNGCCNGLDAMVMAIHAYKSQNNSNNSKHLITTPPRQIMTIVKYNKIDCQMVDAVVGFLRKKC